MKDMWWYSMKYRFDPKSPVITLYATLSYLQTRRTLMALDTGATYTITPWDIVEDYRL